MQPLLEKIQALSEPMLVFTPLPVLKLPKKTSLVAWEYVPSWCIHWPVAANAPESREGAPLATQEAATPTAARTC